MKKHLLAPKKAIFYVLNKLCKYGKENLMDYEYKIEKLLSYDPEKILNADVLILVKKPCELKMLK